jgi:uncharacterized protein (TIGR03083 family)
VDLARQVERDGEVLRVESERLLALAERHWDTPVPTCPDWDVGGLLAHVGGAQRAAMANVRAGGGRVSPRSLPGPPEGKDAVTAWFREGFEELRGALAATDPQAPAWTFRGPDGQHAWWWARRSAQEAMVHRWDADHAVGAAAGRTEVGGFDPEVAAAGIDEHLCDFLPLWPSGRRGDLHGTLHVHTTDTPGEWFVDLDDPSTPTRREHARADTAVRGPATEVLLWVWNRRPPTDPVEAYGDESVLTAWTRVAI